MSSNALRDCCCCCVVVLPARLLMLAWVLLALGLLAGPAAAERANAQPDNDDDEPRYIDEEDVRRWHVDRFFEYVETSPSLRELDAWIHTNGWLYQLRRALGPLGATADEPEVGAYRFCAFVTPGPDPSDRVRTEPFDFGETLRRTYRRSEVRCLGAVSEMRLRYRILPRRGESREIDIVLVHTRHGGYTIGEIIDPALRFCLLETRSEPPQRDDAGDNNEASDDEENEHEWEYWLVAPHEAVAAVRHGTQPTAARPVLEEFLEHRMGLSPPRRRPALQVAAIDLEESTVRFTHRNEEIRLGGHIRDVARQRFRVVGLDEQSVYLANWARVRFRRGLDERDLDLPEDYVYLTPEGEREFNRPTRRRPSTQRSDGQAADEDDDDEAERQTPPPRSAPDLPNRPIGILYLGRDDQDRAVLRRLQPGGNTETVRLERGESITDAQGRTYRLLQITPQRVVFADSRGQGYPIHRE